MIGLTTQAGLFRKAAGGAALQSITLQIDTTKAGTPSDSFQLLTDDVGSDNYVVSWGDGSEDTVVGTQAPLKVYATGGIYTVAITGYLNHIRFNNLGDKAKILTVHNDDGLRDTDWNGGFRNCANMTSFTGVIPEGVTSVSLFCYANNLTEWVVEFPSTLTNMTNLLYNNELTVWNTELPAGLTACGYCWRGNELSEWTTALPVGITTLSNCWLGNNLTEWTVSLPPACKSITNTWKSNFILSWNVPLPAALTQAASAFRDNGMTTFAANMFDACVSLKSLATCFDDNALTEQSVDNILVSLDTAGATGGGLGISGGTNATPSLTGQAAADSLRAKGWTLTLNGY